MKIIATIFLITSFYTSLFAQSKVDSLKQVVLLQSDSVLVDTYMELIKHYFVIEPKADSMVKYARLAVAEAEKHQLVSRIYRTKKSLGIAYAKSNQITDAEKVMNEALALANKEGNLKELIDINNKLGYIYGQTNELEKSVGYYLNNIESYHKLNDFANLALTYANISVLFRTQYQPQKIEFYTRKSLDAISKLKLETDAVVVAELLSRGAQNYFFIGEKSNQQHFIDSALVYANYCLDISQKYQVRGREADAYYIFSHAYRLKKEFDKTIQYAQKALNLKDALPEERIFNIYISLAQSYFESNNYELAQLYLDTCHALQSSKEFDRPMLIAELEFQLFRKTGDFEKALAAYEKYTSLKERFQNEERNKSINNLEIKYQSELKEANIKELNKQKEIDTLRIRSLLAFSGVAFLVILVIIFFYRQSVINNKLKFIETEQRLNRARMNPHFFFNVLASIQTMVLEQQTTRSIATMISKFSKIMRQSLESTYSELVSIEEEIEFISNYLDIQKMRYEHKFDYKIEVADDLDETMIKVPSMLLQPFVENAIEHGFKGLAYDGVLTIRFELVDSELKISCIDNGKGLKQGDTHKAYPSRATQIVKERLTLLNKVYRSNASLDLISELNVGTTVVIHLPVVENNN